jgi:hypothetical protein
MELVYGTECLTYLSMSMKLLFPLRRWQLPHMGIETEVTLTVVYCTPVPRFVVVCMTNSP